MRNAPNPKNICPKCDPAIVFEGSSKKGSEKVLERVLGKGSQKGSEKGVLLWVLQ